MGTEPEITIDPEARVGPARRGQRGVSSMPVAKHRETTHDRRAAIATAARALIVEKGFEGLRTRDIAERVGINIATLHYHVPTKEALIELVAEAAQAEFNEQDQAHPRENMRAAEKLRQELDDFFETMTERRGLLIVMSEFMERARRDPGVKIIFDRMQSHWIGAIREILREGRTDGTFPASLDPDIGAEVFVGALIGNAKMCDGNLPRFKAALDQLERLYLPTVIHSQE